MLEGFKANPSHIIAASTHAAGLLASLPQDSACQRAESENITAMASRRCWYLRANGE
jgi:hypothetical protein